MLLYLASRGCFCVAIVVVITIYLALRILDGVPDIILSD